MLHMKCIYDLDARLKIMDAFPLFFQSMLTKQQNEFKIELKRLEDELLIRLSAAEGNFLGDMELVEKLESTKSTAAEIQLKVQYAILFTNDRDQIT